MGEGKRRKIRALGEPAADEFLSSQSNASLQMRSDSDGREKLMAKQASMGRSEEWAGQADRKR